MNAKYALASLLAMLVLPALLLGQSLKVGDKAPPLGKGEWVKGEPVKEFEEGKVYVVEFWATWCGPCVAAIPHVTELQHKYADKGLVVIGQNVWENNVSAVRPFIEKMGDKMDYRVVLDEPSGQNGHMATQWMRAAGRNGIPCSFIIDQKGVIAWIGHPMQMDEPLEQVMEGKLDPKAEAERAAASEKLEAELMQAIRTGDPEKIMPALDKYAEANPHMKKQLPMIKFGLLMQLEQYEAAYKIADEAISANDDPESLNELAWAIVDPEGGVQNKNLDVAMKAAVKADKLTDHKDASIIDTLARVHFLKGDKEKAIELQKKAVALADDAELKAELEKVLEEYQK